MAPGGGLGAVRPHPSRQALIARLEPLGDDEWLRSGLHPEQGPGTVLDLAINAGLHDLDHLERLSRCLAPLAR